MSEQPQHEIDAALMREYLDSRAEDQRQLGQLEGATTRLASEVGGLREAMTTYESEISKVRESSVSKDDAFEARKQMLENLVQLRLRIRRRTVRRRHAGAVRGDRCRCLRVPCAGRGAPQCVPLPQPRGAGRVAVLRP